jgi:dsDNA-binding SOS-regulon protein
MSVKERQKTKTLELIESLHRSYDKEPGILDEEGLNALSFIWKANQDHQRELLKNTKK